ncbi:MFS transporter [Actinoallomurus rhizosphaericola]|uniref:MFS transporter n=1 Tax=Actinoallomurus rhizosphaericola TaxID=2952536 RepID=UPI002093E6FE|nr:MFS transporter [Actinoallomurus rhizosphaericola]MCO5997036.1 MFS transporter [Actinoallomurus rhizosphaericola]
MSETTPVPMPETRPDPRRWKALAFISVAQLMVLLDGTIVNIALPRMQTALGFSNADRQWVVTAYTLAFGGLLLLGGRLGDMVGRKRVFLTGLAGFALASALGGAATGTGMLLGARALQGVFGALLAPAALSLVATMFTEAGERATAFGIFSAIAMAGSALGLLLGGALTQYIDWRWCLYVNVAFALVAIGGGLAFIREHGGHAGHRLDLPGTALGTGGLLTLVWAFANAEQGGWGSGLTIGLFIASVVLLAAFVVVESRVRTPLLPLRIVTDRTRGGIYLGIGLAMIAMFAQFLFLAYYLQLVKGYSPLRSGVAFLPMTICLTTGSTQIGARLINRVPARLLMVPGMLATALAMVLLAQLTPDSSYWTNVLPAQVVLGLGMGTAFTPGMNLATHRVRPQDTGIASAMLNTSQQVGGSIGTALLNTIAAGATTAGATTAWATAHTPATGTSPRRFALQAVTHGYTTAFWWAAGILVLAAAIVALCVRARHDSETDRSDAATPVMAH